jgi:ubiquinone/menaquinone biosynthesis C-methylase UbiE
MDRILQLKIMFIFNYETLIDPLLRDVRKFIPEFSNMKPGDKVIDVCCGTGAQVMEYGLYGINATGIDNSRDMIDTASRNKTSRKAVKNVSFQLADAADLPFPDACFDYASVSLGLHDKEKPVRYRIVSEMKRVIKKSGAVILIDYRVPLPRHVYGVFARTIESFAGGSHYLSFKDYLANGGLEDILKNHGLKEERRISLKSGLLVAVKAVMQP